MQVKAFLIRRDGQYWTGKTWVNTPARARLFPAFDDACNYRDTMDHARDMGLVVPVMLDLQDEDEDR